MKDPLPGQFDYILQDIRGGLVLPDHFADGDEEEAEEVSTSTRWWEDPTDPDYAEYQQSLKGR